MTSLHLTIISLSFTFLLCILSLQSAHATVPIYEVTITGGANTQTCTSCIVPQNITISRGAAIEWINKDLVPHEIISGKPNDLDNGTIFDTGTINVGKSFLQNFNDVGVFPYFDKKYPWNVGTITVSDSNNLNEIILQKPLCCGPPYVPKSVDSPLKQFKSGIKPEYVKCNHNLNLIIKAEDGSFACVTIKTGIKLVLRGWATTFGTGISPSDYDKCNTLYPQSDTGVAVLYMPTNSVGKICVQYHNLNNTPTGVGMRIFEANNLTKNASNVSVWTYNSTLEANANKTIVYFVKTGAEAGFYGASLNCGGFPLAVGYDVNSTVTASDFPWMGQVFHCGVITYESHIEGTTGIDVKYIPYP